MGTPKVESNFPASLQLPPGLLPPVSTPSHGSMLHGTGSCKPCAWFWKTNGCKNGQACQYCHLCPKSELKEKRKAKVAALRIGALERAADGSDLRAPRSLK